VIGVLVLSHYGLADEFVGALRHIVGDVQHVRGIGLDPASASPEDMRMQIDKALRDVDAGEGVLVLVDMFGGTPSNLSLAFLEEGKIEVVTGVNLPMLLKLVSLRAAGKPIEQLAREVAEAGQKAIGHASDLLRGRMG